LPSTERASPFIVPGTRITAASEPGPATVCPWTIRSYCSNTQRFDATFGDASTARSASPRLPSNGANVGSSPFAGIGRIGRSYTGAFSVRDSAGT
jgi:hypothetical protein